jgi:hypothetical protein
MGCRYPAATQIGLCVLVVKSAFGKRETRVMIAEARHRARTVSGLSACDWAMVAVLALPAAGCPGIRFCSTAAARLFAGGPRTLRVSSRPDRELLWGDAMQCDYTPTLALALLPIKGIVRGNDQISGDSANYPYRD